MPTSEIVAPGAEGSEDWQSPAVGSAVPLGITPCTAWHSCPQRTVCLSCISQLFPVANERSNYGELRWQVAREWAESCDLHGSALTPGALAPPVTDRADVSRDERARVRSADGDDPLVAFASDRGDSVGLLLPAEIGEAAAAQLEARFVGLVHGAVDGLAARATQGGGGSGGSRGGGSASRRAGARRFQSAEVGERHACEATLNSAIREKYRLSAANENALERIRRAVEVVRGVDRTFDLLSSAIERLLARAEPSEVLVQLMLVVEVLRKTEAVAKGAIDDASGTSIARLEVVTV